MAELCKSCAAFPTAPAAVSCYSGVFKEWTAAAVFLEKCRNLLPCLRAAAAHSLQDGAKSYCKQTRINGVYPKSSKLLMGPGEEELSNSLF